MGTRIILADENLIIRQGLRMLLDSQQDIQVIADTRDGSELLHRIDELSPDMVITDVKLRSMSGIEITRLVKAKASCIKIIALSSCIERRFVIGMLTAGASAFLPKDCAFEELLKAIQVVSGGGTYLNQTITDIIVQSYFHHFPEASSSPAHILTNREQEILQFLVEGKTVKEISEKLFLSVKTVETHRQHLMGKLNINSMAGLVKYAIREGLTALEA